MRRTWRTFRRFPSVAFSLLIILFLVGISFYAIVEIPLSETVAMWNTRESNLLEFPRGVPPTWTNLFRRAKLPQTFSLNVGDFETAKKNPLGDTAILETTVLGFDYRYSGFPSGLAFAYDVAYEERPILTLTWVTPDGREIRIYQGIPSRGNHVLRFEAADVLGEPLTTESEGPAARAQRALQGEHSLRIDVLGFDQEKVTITGKLIILGGVHGIAGTDHKRRDIAPGLFWEAPIALMFGFLASISATLLGFTLAAIGAWFGGWVDATIQQLTEVNMMIPFLPTIMMVGWFLSSNIWVLLGFIVGFSILTGRLKTYRAMFLQLKNAEYIEAARAYGASNWRIIFRYMVPHVFPSVFPHIVLGVPRFVFLEASLAFLGIADPKLLTWGKMLSEARHALYTGEYQYVLAPAFLLLLTGLSFSMLGYTLDRIFNPRLREA